MAVTVIHLKYNFHNPEEYLVTIMEKLFQTI